MLTRDLGNLTDRDLHEIGAPDETYSIHVSDGRLIVLTSGGLVAYGS